MSSATASTTGGPQPSSTLHKNGRLAMQRYPFKRGVSNTHLTLAQEIQPLDTSRHSVSLNVTKVRGHLRMLYEFLGSITGRNSAVGTANNCRLGWQKEEISLFSRTIQTKCGAHPASYSMGIGVLSRGKRGRDVKSTTPPCSAEFRNEWNYTTAPPICLHDVDRDNIFNFKRQRITQLISCMYVCMQVWVIF